MLFRLMDYFHNLRVLVRELRECKEQLFYFVDLIIGQISSQLIYQVNEVFPVDRAFICIIRGIGHDTPYRSKYIFKIFGKLRGPFQQFGPGIILYGFFKLPGFF